MLSGLAGRIVLDRTGLIGNWDFDLTFGPEQRLPAPGAPVPVVDADSPSLFTALREQLGLKLEPARAPVDVQVIDSIERPTED